MSEHIVVIRFEDGSEKRFSVSGFMTWIEVETRKTQTLHVSIRSEDPVGEGHPELDEMVPTDYERETWEGRRSEQNAEEGSLGAPSLEHHCLQVRDQGSWIQGATLERWHRIYEASKKPHRRVEFRRGQWWRDPDGQVWELTGLSFDPVRPRTWEDVGVVFEKNGLKASHSAAAILADGWRLVEESVQSPADPRGSESNPGATS